MQPISYARHQFPAEIIRHATWLYLRFTLSYRDVEELLAERGIETSYESVRRWVLKFGPAFARNMRRLRPKPTGTWHLSSHVLVVPRMAVSFGVERDDGLMDRAVEVIRAGEGLVSQGMPLQVAPDPFDVVQLRSVFRQPLDREPVSALGEGGTGGFAGVDRAVIQDEHDRLDRNPDLW